MSKRFFTKSIVCSYRKCVIIKILKKIQERETHMNVSKEVITTLMNGATYEIFIIIAMYNGFKVLLNLEKTKGKIFFVIFFLDMFCLNMPQLYLKTCGNHLEYADFAVSVLSIINTVVYIVALKILTENDYLHIFLADMFSAIVANAIGMGVYVSVAGIIGETHVTLLSLDFPIKNTLAYVAALLIMIEFIFVERILIKKYFSGFYKKKLKMKWLWWILVLLFSVSGYLVTAFNQGDTLIVIISIVMIALTVLILYEMSWWVRIRKEKQIKKENQILSIENAVMKEYYDTLDYQMERTKKFRHDIEKHMNVLKEMVQSKENTEELLSYAAQIEEQYESLQTIDYCGNPVVNAILVNKKYQCQEQGIDMEIKIGKFESGKIKEIDLVAVISNVLDNAIEGCMNIQGNTERKIHFQCGNRNDILFIHVQNTVDAAHKDFAAMQKKTWKRDTYAHGVGLSIVEEIVEKYDGIFEVEIKEEMVEVTVGMHSDL